MFLIVGLGNPGRKYERTRHNAGFDVVELLMDRLRIRTTRLRCKALVGEGELFGQRVALAQPQTFMNLSGESVVQLLNWYKCGVENMIVVYDDVDLAFGQLRVRAKGSSGTHNGMKSVIYLLGRDDFPRVRVGVGRPPERWDMADYVLTGYATPAEREIAFDAYNRAADAIEMIVREGIAKAATFANATKPDSKEER